nr:ABC transporter permease subunit [uncultured Acetatifactor sp.]
MKDRRNKLQESKLAKNDKNVRPRKGVLSYLRRHWIFYAMLALPILYYYLFSYRAMPGVVIAFKNFNMFKGIWESPWVGLEYFERVAQSKTFWLSVRNMMTLNILGLVLGFPLPIILALFLNEISRASFKKTIQTVIYLPHFISWSVVGGMMYQIFASSGLVNTIIKGLGGQAVPFLSNNGWWIFTYFIVGVWKSIGWNTIIYLSAMTGIDQEIYEAARVDGCSGQAFLPRVLMHGRTLAVIWHNVNNPDIWMTHCHFNARKFDEVVSEAGWTFGRKGDSYVGIYSSTPHSFRREGAYAGRELVSDGNETVWMAECGSRREDGSFEDFRKKMTMAEIVREGEQFCFASPGSGRLEFGLTEGFLVDGRQVEIPDDLVNCPYLHSRYGSGRFNYTCPGFTVTQWTYPASE